MDGMSEYARWKRNLPPEPESEYSRWKRKQFVPQGPSMEAAGFNPEFEQAKQGLFHPPVADLTPAYRPLPTVSSLMPAAHQRARSFGERMVQDYPAYEDSAPADGMPGVANLGAIGRVWDTIGTALTPAWRVAAPTAEWIGKKMRPLTDMAGDINQPGDLGAPMMPGEPYQMPPETFRPELPAHVETPWDKADRLATEQAEAPANQKPRNKGARLWDLPIVGEAFNPERPTVSQALTEQGWNPLLAMGAEMFIPGGPLEALGLTGRIARGVEGLARAKGGEVGKLLAEPLEFGRPIPTPQDLANERALQDAAARSRSPEVHPYAAGGERTNALMKGVEDERSAARAIEEERASARAIPEEPVPNVESPLAKWMEEEKPKPLIDERQPLVAEPQPQGSHLLGEMQDYRQSLLSPKTEAEQVLADAGKAELPISERQPMVVEAQPLVAESIAEPSLNPSPASLFEDVPPNPPTPENPNILSEMRTKTPPEKPFANLTGLNFEPGESFVPKNVQQGTPPPAIDSYSVMGHTVQMGGQEFAKSLPMPVLHNLVEQLTGSAPSISEGLQKLGKKLGGTVGGRFIARAGQSGKILLNPEIFKNPDQARRIFAHEIGHMVDWTKGWFPGDSGLVGNVKTIRSAISKNAGAVLGGKDVRAELQALSEWWKPYNKANATVAFRKYRNSSDELFADAVSVLLNDSEEFQRRAPKFAKHFFEELKKNPELGQAFTDAANTMSGTFEDFAKGLEQHVATDFIDGEKFVRETRIAAQQRKGSWWERLRQQLDALQDAAAVGLVNKNAFANRALDASEKAGVPSQGGKHVLDEMAFSKNRSLITASDASDRVMKPLEEAGIEEDYAGRYMMLRRIAQGDRSTVANSYLIDADTASRMLHEMEKSDPSKLAKTEKIVSHFNDMLWERMQELHSHGYFSDDLMKKLEVNKDTYARFQVLHHMEEDLAKNIHGEVGGLVQKQVGTTSGIVNPFAETLGQIFKADRLIEHVSARNIASEPLLRAFPDEWELAQTAGPNEWVAPPKDKKLFFRWENGKKVGYYADPYIAEVFERTPSGALAVIAKAVGFVDNAIFKNLWIRKSISFMSMNPVRDFGRTARNVAALRDEANAAAGMGAMERGSRNLLTGPELALQYGKAWKKARQYAKNDISDPVVRQMIKEKSIDVPENSAYAGEAFTETPEMELSKAQEMLLRQGGIKPDGITAKKSNLFMRAYSAFMDKWSEAGRTLEALPKIAGREMLSKTKSGSELAYDVRKFVGTPDFRAKGTATEITNNVLMFSNIMVQGWKADLEMATRPTTRGGWWLNMATNSLAPRAFMAAGAVGYFGPQLKEMYDHMPEYLKSQYLTIPTGWVDGGEYGKKVSYFRIPQDETARLFGGLTWKLLNAPNSGLDLEDTFGDMLKFTKGQLTPGISATYKMARNALSVASGENPEDDFYGKPIIDRTDFAAGGSARWKGFAKWSIGQLGTPGSVAKAYFWPEDARAPMKGIFPFNEVLKPFFGVTDRGVSEIQERGKHNEEKAKKKLKSALGDVTDYLTKQAYHFRSTPAKLRTNEQKKAYLLTSQFEATVRTAEARIARLKRNGHEPEIQEVRDKLEEDAKKVREKLKAIMAPNP